MRPPCIICPTRMRNRMTTDADGEEDMTALMTRATPEQRFALMLLERVDALEAECETMGRELCVRRLYDAGRNEFDDGETIALWSAGEPISEARVRNGSALDGARLGTRVRMPLACCDDGDVHLFVDMRVAVVVPNMPDGGGIGRHGSVSLRQGATVLELLRAVHTRIVEPMPRDVLAVYIRTFRKLEELQAYPENALVNISALEALDPAPSLVDVANFHVNNSSMKRRVRFAFEGVRVELGGTLAVRWSPVMVDDGSSAIAVLGLVRR